MCPFQTIADLELSVAHLEDKQERDFEKHKKVREDNQVMMNNDYISFLTCFYYLFAACFYNEIKQPD